MVTPPVGRVVHCCDIHRRAARRRQRPTTALRTGVAVVESPVDLRAGRWCIRAVGVVQAGEGFIHPGLRGVVVEVNDERATGVGVGADGGT